MTRTSIARLADDAPVPHPDSWPSRKPPFVSYADCPDCGATKAETSVLGFWCEHDRCPIFAKPSPPNMHESPTAAYDDACAAIRAYAARTARSKIKSIARYFLAEPWQLDMLRPGFIASGFTPGQLIEFAKELLRQELEFCERMAPHRIELVPVKNWNARATILAGRYRRAKASQLARRVA